MKVLLMLMAMISLGLAGVSAGSACRRRARLLRQIVREIGRLQERVRLGHPLQFALLQADLPAMKDMAKEIEAQGVFAAWKQITDDGRYRALEKKELQTLDQLWRDMGQLDRHSQLSRFDEAISALAELRDEAVRQSGQQSRLYGYLGVLAGLAAGVLLW